jgi:predicted enzyme related to lactoylglutathione lyase
VLDSDPQAANPGGGFSAATGFRYCSFQVTEIEAFVAQCQAAGSQVIVAPTEIRPGVKAAVVEDPDGNTLEFMQFDAQ